VWRPTCSADSGFDLIDAALGRERNAGTKIRVWNHNRGVLVADTAVVADTSRLRRVGLLKRLGLERGEGLWIVPCEAVHSFFMRFVIDVVFLNRANRVVKVRPGLKPWRVTGCARAHSVLELPEGTIAATGTRAGDLLELGRAG
jgi:uncharacterized protein